MSANFEIALVFKAVDQTGAPTASVVRGLDSVAQKSRELLGTSAAVSQGASEAAKTASQSIRQMSTASVAGLNHVAAKVQEAVKVPVAHTQAPVDVALVPALHGADQVAAKVQEAVKVPVTHTQASVGVALVPALHGADQVAAKVQEAVKVPATNTQAPVNVALVPALHGADQVAGQVQEAVKVPVTHTQAPVNVVLVPALHGADQVAAKVQEATRDAHRPVAVPAAAARMTFGPQASRAGQAATTLGQEILKAGKASEAMGVQAGGSFDAVRMENRKLMTQILANSQAVSVFGGTAVTASSRAATSVQTFGDRSAQASQAIRKIGQDGGEAGQKVVDGFRGSAKAMEEMRQKALKTADTMRNAGLVVTATGAGMLGSLYKPVQAWAESESVMTKAKLPFMRAKGGLDPVWRELQPIIDRLGQALPGTSADFGEIAGSAHAAGLAARDLRDGGLEAAAALKILGDLTNQEAGDLTVQMSRALQVSGKEFKAFADLAQKTRYAAGISIRELAVAIPYMGPQLAALDIKGLPGAEAVSTLMTMMKSAGLSGTEIGTGIGELVNNLPNLGAKFAHGRGWKAKEGTALAQKYNLGNLTQSLFDSKGNLIGDDAMAKAANVVVLFDRINTAITSKQDKLIFFRELLGDVAQRAGLKFTKGGWNEAQARIQEQADIQTRLNEVLQTQASLWEALTGTAKIFLKSIAEPLGPLFKGATKALNALTGKLADWNKDHPKLTAVVAGSIGVVGLLLVGVGGLMLGVGLLGKVLLASTKGFGDWKELIQLSRGTIQSLGNDALVASGKLGILARVRQSGLGMKARAIEGWNTPFKGLGGTLKTGFKGFGGALKSGFKAPFTASFWKGLGGGMKSMGGRLKFMVPKLSGAHSLFSGAGLLGPAKGLGGALKAAFMFPIKGLGAVVAAVGWPVIAIIAAIAVAALLIYKYWEPIKAFFSGIWEGFKENLDLVMPAWDAFTEAVGGVFKALVSLVDIFMPVQEGQEGANGAMEKGKAIGKGLAWVFGIVLTAAKWAAQGVEAIVIIVVTLVDALVQAGKTIWKVLTGDWKNIGKDWSGFSERFWKRLENSSMNPDKPAEAMEKAGAPGKAAAPPPGKDAPGSPAKPSPNGEGKPAPKIDLPKLIQPQGGAERSAPVQVNYSPTIKLEGKAGPEDEARILKILDRHKHEVAAMVETVLERQGKWNGRK